MNIKGTLRREGAKTWWGKGERGRERRGECWTGGRRVVVSIRDRLATGGGEPWRVAPTRPQDRPRRLPTSTFGSDLGSTLPHFFLSPFLFSPVFSSANGSKCLIICISSCVYIRVSLVKQHVPLPSLELGKCVIQGLDGCHKNA